MLDRWSAGWVKRPLEGLAAPLKARGVHADRVTVAGFGIGLLAVPALAMKWYGIALLLILANRIADGIDGILARDAGPSDAGGFLDIVLDFIFYSAVVMGFALADPGRNALAAAVLIFSFVGTGSSFLGFAAMVEKQGRSPEVPAAKSIHYLEGLTEGTETILFYVAICLFPEAFPALALMFAAACGITTVTRIRRAYRALV
ncbi:CDP-alcohol phosphatidyltransferase family protein [Desulfoluna spongiiphila]|uniref:CDP-alcohol phosphatidyltransferase family protein n=1 Tax=Desulfoluna spongiiphila TaxID=419481 RepID=UPI001251C6E1|nr:CDP-alcohol phosphatidyltransferase family protein [Desulfoluna spongiiphila]VVS92453.1 cdp-alcohol phosphatidyltransferase [Desulfoluna spongiiphila]